MTRTDATCFGQLLSFLLTEVAFMKRTETERAGLEAEWAGVSTFVHLSVEDSLAREVHLTAKRRSLSNDMRFEEAWT